MFQIFILLDANDDSLISKEEVDKAEISVSMVNVLILFTLNHTT